MTPTTTTWKHLAPNPKSSYKQLFVRGTRMTARTLFGWYAGPEPTPPDEIARQFNLPVEAVLEAVAYCESNPPELLDDYAVEQALVDESSKCPGGRLSPQEVARIRREHRIHGS